MRNYESYLLIFIKYTIAGVIVEFDFDGCKIAYYDRSLAL